MTQTIRGICSMAPRPILEPLFANHTVGDNLQVRFEATGGVDVAKRVSNGESFDLVVLAAKAIETLAENGHLIAQTQTSFACSSVAIAVANAANAPDVSSQDKLRQVLIDAAHIGYSTGPSGTALLRQIETWGLTDRLKEKLVQAPPGTPVGKLIAQGQVEIGFQQQSELMHLPGIRIIGSMPPGCEIDTIFAGAVCKNATQPESARNALTFLSSAVARKFIQDNGMTPA